MIVLGFQQLSKMTVLASRLASGSLQSVPVRRGLAAGLAILSGSAAMYLWTTQTSGLASQGAVDSFVNVEQGRHPEGMVSIALWLGEVPHQHAL